MPRKKISEDVSDVAAAEKLEDDEEIIISDVRTIKRGRKPNAIEPSTDEEDFIDAEIEESPFPIGTVGHILSQSEDERFQHTQCDILVVRKPDSAGEKFLKPCVSRISEAPLRNIELTQSQTEIQELVRTHYGGGHYYLQIKIGNQLQTGWSCDLADAPEAIARARAEHIAALNPARTPQTQPPAGEPINPFQQFFETLKQQRDLQDLLFGDEKRRLEAEIERLRTENARPIQPANQSDLAMLLSAMKETNNPTIVEFAREYLSPENKEPAFGVWDFAKYVFDNKDQVAGLASMLLGGMMPQPSAGGIESMLRQSPPAGSLPATVEPSAASEPAVRSNFRRKTQTEPVSQEPTIDNDIDSNNAGMEAAASE